MTSASYERCNSSPFQTKIIQLNVSGSVKALSKTVLSFTVICFIQKNLRWLGNVHIVKKKKKWTGVLAMTTATKKKASPENKHLPSCDYFTIISSCSYSTMERFHMTSKQPYRCSKTKKRRPCWSTKLNPRN